jgi:hypothetical protein
LSPHHPDAVDDELEPEHASPIVPGRTRARATPALHHRRTEAYCPITRRHDDYRSADRARRRQSAQGNSAGRWWVCCGYFLVSSEADGGAA